jgi:hypothetical protein
LSFPPLDSSLEHPCQEGGRPQEPQAAPDRLLAPCRPNLSLLRLQGILTPLQSEKEKEKETEKEKEKETENEKENEKAKEKKKEKEKESDLHPALQVLQAAPLLPSLQQAQVVLDRVQILLESLGVVVDLLLCNNSKYYMSLIGKYLDTVNLLYVVGHVFHLYTMALQ